MEPIGSSRRTGQPLAVVVGAGGMAMAVARRLGDTYRILLADRDGEHLDRQVAALNTEGHDARGVVCDVVDPAAVAALAREAADAGPVRALAHVVGLSPSLGNGPTVLRVNLVGPTLVADAFVDVMAPGGASVFIASLAGHLVAPTPEVMAALDAPLSPGFVDAVAAAIDGELSSTVAYQLSKAALIRMCQRRAGAWGARGTRIVSLSPGLIATPQGALEFKAQPEKTRLFELSPLPREGTMIEIADAVEFLLSDRASFISGTDLLVDGGLAAAAREAATVSS
ncbi:MAG TPA: SDR family oxidoreductase [Mycobacteriales bacterium]|jgi:NAD(P)-dependent dehydrogenase (short-subunit alcohol dehydrogenase family)|nr:SDR family oxidoreductase [Mycobacteriales bacterium]